MTERAVQRDESVADQAVGKEAAFGGRRRGNGVAGDTLRQRHMPAAVRLAVKAVVAVPILVQNIAKAQIRNPGAAQLAKTGERRGKRCAAEQDVDDVAGTLQRRAVVRRTEKNEVPEPSRPGQSVLLGIVRRAAHDQTAHAVRQHADLFNRDRPVPE